MDWSQRTRSLGLIILSVFIVWHAIGIAVVGPFGKSYLRDSLMRLYHNYLAVFHLDRSWPFYAPNPFLGSILNYETVSASGETKIYPLTHAREKFDHAYFRYTNFYAYLFNDPDYSKRRGYDKSVAHYLCKQHAGRNITAINFILFSQRPFSYEDYQKGKRPLDEEFLERKAFGPYHCEQS
ncbi:MAG: hypothetical protein L0Z73_16695 [Gammaproteobacteria bacterium]|nr:hypothetical protein [Gammaproteobacteria bacterium]